MQDFHSEYGLGGCRVPDACPTRAIRRHLGRVNVATSPADIAAEVRAEITLRVARHPEDATAWTPTMRRAAVRYALWAARGESRGICHRDGRELVTENPSAAVPCRSREPNVWPNVRARKQFGEFAKRLAERSDSVPRFST